MKPPGRHNDRLSEKVLKNKLGALYRKKADGVAENLIEFSIVIAPFVKSEIQNSFVRVKPSQHFERKVSRTEAMGLSTLQDYVGPHDVARQANQPKEPRNRTERRQCP